MKLFVTIAMAAGVLAAPAVAQTPSPQQMLQGLLSGNQGQDQAVREAYERGYRAGRQDEARIASGSGRGSRYDNRDDDRGGYGRSDEPAGGGRYGNSYSR